MCRFLFRGSAPVKQGKDAFADADLIKPGDPIDAFPDGHVFGKGETAPLFVIVDVPGMSVAQGRLLCAPMVKERDALGNVDRTKPIALIRSFNITLANIKSLMTGTEFMGALVQKTPVENPLVIGDSSEVIG